MGEFTLLLLLPHKRLSDMLSMGGVFGYFEANRALGVR